jgi:tRNA threonylcarbamoyladenosine biosynthesis protein TsaE
VASVVRPGAVLALSGGLGSGKTTFTRALFRALGVQRLVKSPTFTIVVSYSVRSRGIRSAHHIDLYRLQRILPEDRLTFLELLSEPGAIFVLEWPYRIRKLLPASSFFVRFAVTGSSERTITIKTKSLSRRALERLARCFLKTSAVRS